MTLPTNDLLAIDNKRLSRKPSTRTFQAIAAGFSWKGFDNWIESEIADGVDACTTAAGSLIDGARGLIHGLF